MTLSARRLDRHGASFETPAPQAPQDEVISQFHHRLILILRRPQRGRLEGRRVFATLSHVDGTIAARLDAEMVTDQSVDRDQALAFARSS